MFLTVARILLTTGGMAKVKKKVAIESRQADDKMVDKSKPTRTKTRQYPFQLFLHVENKNRQ